MMKPPFICPSANMIYQSTTADEDDCHYNVENQQDNEHHGEYSREYPVPIHAHIKAPATSPIKIPTNNAQHINTQVASYICCSALVLFMLPMALVQKHHIEPLRSRHSLSFVRKKYHSNLIPW